jgi:hypothetical protein
MFLLFFGCKLLFGATESASSPAFHLRYLSRSRTALLAPPKARSLAKRLLPNPLRPMTTRQLLFSAQRNFILTTWRKPFLGQRTFALTRLLQPPLTHVCRLGFEFLTKKLERGENAKEGVKR